MKAIIRVNVPEFQIGQEVTVFFKDTMMKKGICEAGDIVRCKDCKYGEPGNCGYGIDCEGVWHDDDWFCAAGERK